MNDIEVVASSIAAEADLPNAKMGSRFGRMDLLSQFALLSVELLKVNFDTMDRTRIGVCMAVTAGSLPTDIDYWKSRVEVGGPSPTLFAYTLPSSAIGEIAIRYRLTGPNLCFVGTDKMLGPEARDLIARNELDGCVCVSAKVISAAAAKLISAQPRSEAHAFFLVRTTPELELKENHVTLSHPAR